MMKNIKLIKNPGYMFDLFFIFFLKYNTEYCMDTLLNNKKRQEDQTYYKEILKLFEPISDDLYVFFHALQNKQCFMTLNYFYKYKTLFLTDYSLTTVQDALANHAEVTKNVISYYFYKLTEEDVDACLASNKHLFKIIKDSDYSDTEKSRLYEFFMDPGWHIQKLQYELMSKDLILNRFYEKNYPRILEAHNNITVDSLVEQLKPIDNLDFLKKGDIEGALSFCLLNKYCLNCVSLKNGIIYLLGDEYAVGIEATANRKSSVKLDEFGSALSEENRVKMLDLMLERGEISCKDLERIFNFSGSTAYHHLTILMKSGVIKTRNEGKTILYSVNAECFNVVIDILSKYSAGKKGVK